MTTQLHEMFCNQCEQAAHGTGCTKIGIVRQVAGGRGASGPARPRVSLALPRSPRRRPRPADLTAEARFVEDALFTTLTNVDFDATTVAAKVDEAARTCGTTLAAAARGAHLGRT